jgi:hypothetical protein
MLGMRFDVFPLSHLMKLEFGTFFGCRYPSVH